MTNKLELNDEIKKFLDAEKNPIWNLILEDKIEELKELSSNKGSIDLVVNNLFSEGKSDFLDTYDFITIKESNGEFIRDLVRLIFSLDLNGKYDNLLAIISSKLMDVLPEVVDRIQKDTFGYPARIVENYVLSESATVRAALLNLIYYYKHKGDAEFLHFVTELRTTITLAIMGNYKNIVGHDLVETAKIKEQIGEEDAALSFYNGAKENLKNELHWFIESPEMGPSEEDVVMLQSLKEAYLSLDRLKGTSLYTKECSLIDEILTREYIEFDFDEEDEDED